MANIVQWQDLFVVVDDGHISIQEYDRLEPLVRAQARSCPDGLACLVIIPEKAVAPPAAARQHLAELLRRAPIRVLGYLVEGTGFKAASVRAVLIGLGIFQRNRYSTQVFTTLNSALEWLLAGAKGQGQVSAALQAIADVRASE